ncbi:tRNA lysidine(34) synthetase TilS [Xylanimonas oleitrophica]|uniref:tRNA(Ile)-lysidine synthase n=1 Tax=Xylanimonas oleitrophica TaxID=2607479 RepID=A0A2W5Y251_9MICO|nr:tRNA lysidine(34) synthetase TilS [Xylanimonas oleitrophica]PZR51594.1 tRNA lysidine(34) synthetase TilS [Xylanimonas oleitrophica]
MARVDPAVAALRTAVRGDLAALRPAPGDLVLVACSGGPDSLALAAALAHEARRVGRSVRSRGFAVRVGAVVVDHGLQPGSADVAAQAARQCAALGLDPVVVRRAVVHDDGAGPEGAAREARYAVLDAVAADLGAVAVLLGHTLDDQAESVLLGLARGSGARSLAGMPAVRGRYRRPLLGLRRAQTRAACSALGLRPWDDPTNFPPGKGSAPAWYAGEPGARPATEAEPGVVPLRTRVRHELLPVLEDVLGLGAVEALARTAGLLRADADVLDVLAADVLARATVPAPEPGPARDEPRAGSGSAGESGGTSCEPDGADGAEGADGPDGVGGAGGLVLDAGVLAAAPEALRRRALRAAALAVGCPPAATTARHVEALDALVVGWHGQGELSLPSDARARHACGRLFLHPGPAAVPTPVVPEE